MVYFILFVHVTLDVTTDGIGTTTLTTLAVRVTSDDITTTEAGQPTTEVGQPTTEAGQPTTEAFPSTEESQSTTTAFPTTTASISTAQQGDGIRTKEIITTLAATTFQQNTSNTSQVQTVIPEIVSII